jgi:Tfp pilus assembly protein FimV
MRTPTESELQHLMGAVTKVYDPVKAHEYYEKHKKLKGRKRGTSQPAASSRTGRHVPGAAKARQRKELQARIQNLSKKLAELEDLIKKKEHAEASENRKAKAKKERAAKEANKPKTAAEKAKAARENKKFRDKHKQELKTKAKQASNKSGGSSSKTKASGSKKAASVSELKSLATKVRGQIAVAKQKLAAL